jgi:hypothetical protein
MSGCYIFFPICPDTTGQKITGTAPPLTDEKLYRYNKLYLFARNLWRGSWQGCGALNQRHGFLI